LQFANASLPGEACANILELVATDKVLPQERCGGIQEKESGVALIEQNKFAIKLIVDDGRIDFRVDKRTGGLSFS
jgi:hypothetical protein